MQSHFPFTVGHPEMKNVTFLCNAVIKCRRNKESQPVCKLLQLIQIEFNIFWRSVMNWIVLSSRFHPHYTQLTKFHVSFFLFIS